MSTRFKTWDVLNYGRVPPNSPTIPLQNECGHEAELPVLGRVLAITLSGGVIFDVGDFALPLEIRCRRCGRVYQSDDICKSKEITK